MDGKEGGQLAKKSTEYEITSYYKDAGKKQ
jgi:hypothetical protein